VLVAELKRILDSLAPAGLAEPWDNSGLLVGDERAPVRRVLVALELTEPVLSEALTGGYDTVLVHHPLLFSPVRSLVESHPREALLRGLVAARITLIACHTNLDSARGGLAELAGDALGLVGMVPLKRACAGWYKLIGFVPQTAVESVASAVFASGAGTIGNYRDCAFSAAGSGWFTPGAGSLPTVGRIGEPKRTPEARWETVVPRERLAAAISAFVAAHPYEEPAFDVYPVEDVLANVGLGRVGELPAPLAIETLAVRAAETFGLSALRWTGDGRRVVRRVGVVPGSGHSLIDEAAEVCEVLVTGDLGYHDADKAAEVGVSLIDVPHGDFEWWALRRWTAAVTHVFEEAELTVAVSKAWNSPWNYCRGAEAGRDAGPCCGGRGIVASQVRIWIDGGSRGNPGPSAIGVVVEDPGGNILDTASRAIGTATNNVAEYRALLAGLEMVERMGAREVEVASDSELLVKQMRGEYKVKNEGLKPLYAEARRRADGFSRFAIRHVEREQNVRADALVNRALDERERAGL